VPGDSAKTTRHGLLAISAVVEPRIARQNGHSTAAFEGIGEGASRSADWADVLLTVPSDPCHRLPETACPKSPPKAANKSSKSVSTRSLGRRFFGLRALTEDSPSSCYRSSLEMASPALLPPRPRAHAQSRVASAPKPGMDTSTDASRVSPTKIRDSEIATQPPFPQMKTQVSKNCSSPTMRRHGAFRDIRTRPSGRKTTDAGRIRVRSWPAALRSLT